MTRHDIALLLADAADEVEIGIAPTQALIRGGRRRKARRWAVAAAATLVVAGSTGALAVTGLSDDEDRTLPAVRPTVPETPNAVEPRGGILATGTDEGRRWTVSIDSWRAPKDTADARSVLDAMAEYREYPADVSTAADLVGKIAYFVYHTTDDAVGEDSQSTLIAQNLVPEGDTLSGTDVEAAAVPLFPEDGSQRLVVGHVAKTARQVTCAWKDGTTTTIERAVSDDINHNETLIRDPEGSPYSWFVCLAPRGTAYQSVEVTGQTSR
ncbi:hypothetical protein [Streptomyces antibioticus]|uniref:hypothetical protein n=1 Tax=Streptomyces antibioticus TaxID=1890 RepID=UPI0022553B7C|nr:hypothetical protein [Streptomyces antibioticus]MCX4739495.1 hypothetical protein [Streptomyces antibioticus]